MATLMCIDGNSLTYRAFFALPTDMATASGQVTNAVYGFTSMLCNLVRDHEPDMLVVAFDLPQPTFRHDRLESYKANRESAPDILRQQMGLVRQLVETMSIPIVEVPGFEADDVIATLCRLSTESGHRSIVVTGDRDSYQLVQDPYVKVLYNRRGVSDYALYDEQGIFERTGVTPKQYVWYAAMRGDPSDNLPGIPGVGEKTAAKLINQYGDLEGVLKNAENQSPKLRANLIESAEAARLNAELMKLVDTVDIGVTLEDLHRVTPDADAVDELFTFLEFGSLRQRFSEAFGASSQDAPQRVELHAEITVATPASWEEVAAGLEGRDVVVEMLWAGPPGKSALVGLAIVTDPALSEVVWVDDPLSESWGSTMDTFFAQHRLIAHDIKPLLRRLMDSDRACPAVAFDTKIGAYLLDPADPRYSLAELLGRYTEVELNQPEPGDSSQLSFDQPANDDRQLVGRQALAVAALHEVIAQGVNTQGLSSLFYEIELPLVTVLASMEHLGVQVDVEALEALNASLTRQCEELRHQIVEEAGVNFNVNSTKQLREVLFDRLGLTPQKKTKTGFSTDASTLEKMRGDHPIIEALLSYREVEKLRGTYGEGLLHEVGPDRRIHATFNQTVARTGRLSSDAPNLHNIPVRSDAGKVFRKVFVAPQGCELLVADYNQIELRCIAHLAHDPGLIEAFVSGQDIHDETAARVFGVERAEVTSAQRSKAKMVSYGLAYGMEAYGLAQRLNISTGEAKEILDAYFVAFPEVASYMERTVAEARERGYTETLFGRRRRIPELASGVRSVRMAGERQAMNAGIQGLAADIFKVALVRIYDMLAQRHPTSRLILQVHDEVVCEVPTAEMQRVTSDVVEVMRSAFHMDVPLDVNVSSGPTWADAKG